MDITINARPIALHQRTDVLGGTRAMRARDACASTNGSSDISLDARATDDDERGGEAGCAL